MQGVAKKPNKSGSLHRLQEAAEHQEAQQRETPYAPSGILAQYEAPPTTNARISTALDPTQIFPHDAIAAVRGSESVDLRSLQRLALETWLNDQVINYVAKQVIQPALVGTLCYSSYFFSRLRHNAC